jgi:hypothetical protein
MWPGIPRIALVSSVILALQGCAPVPSKEQAGNLEQAIARGNFAQIAGQATMVGNLGEKGGGDLSWRLNAASGHLFAAEFPKSKQQFDIVDSVVNNEDAKTISLNTNYRLRVYDKMMVNTYTALAVLASEGADRARPEFARAEDRARQAEEYFAKEIAAADAKAAKDANEGKIDLTAAFSKLGEDANYRQTVAQLASYASTKPFFNPVQTYLQGVFLASSSSASDLERARGNFRRLLEITTAKSLVQQDLAFVEARIAGKAAQPMVWVIFENGQSALLRQYNVTLPVPVLGQRGVSVGVATVALPRFEPQALAYQGLGVRAGASTQGSVPLADFDAVMGAEFNKRYSSIVGRAVAEVALKVVLQSAANKSGNAVLQVAALVASQVSTTDTRTWTMLPKRFDVARVQAPADGVLRVDAVGASPVSVKVPQGRSAIVVIKAMRPGSPLVATIYPL